MAIEGMSITGFQKSWSIMNLDVYKNDNELYNKYLAFAEIQEFNKGFKIKRVGKSTRKGTTITFEAIKTEEEYKTLKADIVVRHKEFLI